MKKYFVGVLFGTVAFIGYCHWANADVCFLPEDKDCTQTPYREGIDCLGRDCPEPNSEGDDDVCDSAYNSTDPKGGNWICPKCEVANNQYKYDNDNCICELTAKPGYKINNYTCEYEALQCQQGATTDCSVEANDKCHICASTEPKTYAGEAECKTKTQVVVCPEGYVPNAKPTSGCYNKENDECGSDTICYQTYTIKCNQDHKHAFGPDDNGVCKCVCDENYHENEKGECVNDGYWCIQTYVMRANGSVEITSLSGTNVTYNNNKCQFSWYVPDGTEVTISYSNTVQAPYNHLGWWFDEDADGGEIENGYNSGSYFTGNTFTANVKTFNAYNNGDNHLQSDAVSESDSDHNVDLAPTVSKNADIVPDDGCDYVQDIDCDVRYYVLHGMSDMDDTNVLDINPRYGEDSGNNAPVITMDQASVFNLYKTQAMNNAANGDVLLDSDECEAFYGINGSNPQYSNVCRINYEPKCVIVFDEGYFAKTYTTNGFVNRVMIQTTCHATFFDENGSSGGSIEFNPNELAIFEGRGYASCDEFANIFSGGKCLKDTEYCSFEEPDAYSRSLIKYASKKKVNPATNKTEDCWYATGCQSTQLSNDYCNISLKDTGDTGRFELTNRGWHDKILDKYYDKTCIENLSSNKCLDWVIPASNDQYCTYDGTNEDYTTTPYPYAPTGEVQYRPVIIDLAKYGMTSFDVQNGKPYPEDSIIRDYSSLWPNGSTNKYFNYEYMSKNSVIDSNDSRFGYEYAEGKGKDGENYLCVPFQCPAGSAPADNMIEYNPDVPFSGYGISCVNGSGAVSTSTKIKVYTETFWCAPEHYSSIDNTSTKEECTFNDQNGEYVINTYEYLYGAAVDGLGLLPSKTEQGNICQSWIYGIPPEGYKVEGDIDDYAWDGSTCYHIYVEDDVLKTTDVGADAEECEHNTSYDYSCYTFVTNENKSKVDYPIIEW